MVATAQLLKLFSRKRKEEMHSFQRVNDEEAWRRFTEELDFETEVAQAAVLSAILLSKNQERREVFQFSFGPRTLLFLYWFPRHLFSSVGFVQVLGLCEHILYLTAKRPLALCIEMFRPEVCSPDGDSPEAKDDSTDDTNQ